MSTCTSQLVSSRPRCPCRVPLCVAIVDARDVTKACTSDAADAYDPVSWRSQLRSCWRHASRHSSLTRLRLRAHIHGAYKFGELKLPDFSRFSRPSEQFPGNYEEKTRCNELSAASLFPEVQNILFNNIL